ncbi:MAG: nickel pincer cofactor biosynthesis protein LarC [Deltaproteobacteria bacterium]|nr:MAG: nickel pincer cofactor biosynthesis protein LarC [Deltaproteobacteria bacterium]
MTVLALEPVGGIAGDMMLAALLHLGAPRSALDESVAALADASGALDLRGTRVTAEPVEVSGIQALHVEVRVPPEVLHREPHHRPWRAIRELLGRARLPDRARELALLAFTRLAEAEGRVHGVPADEVEFHEVGAVDSIVDVVGSAALVAALAPARIVSLPPPSGGGTARAAHGPIPIPGPAVLEVMRGRALRPSGPGERTTPTGAALLAAWTETAESLPEMSVQAVGYGAGSRRWEDAPNLLRAVLGAAVGGQPREGAGWVLEANLDDLSPQLVAAALEAVLAAGAADAWIAPVTMKKGRPGHLLGAVVPEAARSAVEEALFRETSTLGIRAYRVERSVLDRELVEVATPYGPVRVKLGRRAGAVINAAPEFEDCRLRAREHGVGVKEVLAAALAAWRSR